MEEFSISEMREDLNAAFGDPKAISELNAYYMLRLITENAADGHVNRNYPEPSIQATCMTFLAFCYYPTKTWEELAESKRAIKRKLTYIAINCNGNMDKVEELLMRLMQRVGDKNVINKVQGYRKLLHTLAKEDIPTRLIDYITHSEHYDAISNGLHKVIRSGHDRDAAYCVSAAIEDGLLLATTPRSLLIEEFKLNKSGFNKYFSQFQMEREQLSSNEQKILDNKKAIYKENLRSLIGYTRSSNGELVFSESPVSSRNFITNAVAYVRSMLSLDQEP